MEVSQLNSPLQAEKLEGMELRTTDQLDILKTGRLKETTKRQRSNI